MIKALVFDCFGVLTTDEWREFVDNLDDPSIASEARSLNQAFGAGIINENDFVENVTNLTGQHPPITENALEISKNYKLLEYIGNLRMRGYIIGLLSNIASNWIRDTLLSQDEQKLFDEMVMSFEVGMTKPNPNIFQLICNKLEVNPSEAIMVDDIEHYCSSAESVGMKSIVYKSFKQFKVDLDLLLKEN